MTRDTLLMYCQHSLGLGHLKRSWALAAALAADFRVVLLTGGAKPSGLKPPPSVEIVELPPLAQDVDGGLVSLDAARSVDEACAARATAIQETFRALSPAVLMIELFPFGRRKFGGELVPLLDAALRAETLVVSSVRDILVDRGADQQHHDERARAIVDRYFDAVLVHADPRVAVLEDSFRPRMPLAAPVHYTGYVIGEPHASATAADRRAILVSAGGGRYGEPLVRAAMEASTHVRSACGLRMTIVAGPLCPDATWSWLQAAAADRPDVQVERVVPDLPVRLQRAAASVSQCGYNTALEILASGVPALVVPFAEGGENEQATRARRLEQMGAVRVLGSDRLSGSVLAAEILETLRFRPAPQSIDMNGAGRTAQLVSALLHDKERGSKRVARDSQSRQATLKGSPYV